VSGVADEGPYYSEECADTAWPVLRQYLIPLLSGQDGCLGPGLRPAAGQGSREPYGQGSSRKRSLGS